MQQTVTLSPEIRLMRLAFDGVTDVAAHAPDLADLARAHEPALARIRALGQAHDHGAPSTAADVAAHFDRLAALDPDLAVAAYSFGDAALLADFTHEVVAVAGAWTALGGDVLDFGCGAGRIAAALVRHGARVTGVDVSAAMIAIARARVPGAAFVLGDGATLPLPDAAFDLALAVDSFPFLVQTGRDRRAARRDRARAAAGRAVARVQLDLRRSWRGGRAHRRVAVHFGARARAAVRALGRDRVSAGAVSGDVGRSEWEALWAADPRATPFQHPAWALPHAARFAGEIRYASARGRMAR